MSDLTATTIQHQFKQSTTASGYLFITVGKSTDHSWLRTSLTGSTRLKDHSSQRALIIKASPKLSGRMVADDVKLLDKHQWMSNQVIHQFILLIAGNNGYISPSSKGKASIKLHWIIFQGVAVDMMLRANLWKEYHLQIQTGFSTIFILKKRTSRDDSGYIHTTLCSSTRLWKTSGSDT